MTDMRDINSPNLIWLVPSEKSLHKQIGGRVDGLLTVVKVDWKCQNNSGLWKVMGTRVLCSHNGEKTYDQN